MIKGPRRPDLKNRGQLHLNRRGCSVTLVRVPGQRPGAALQPGERPVRRPRHDGHHGIDDLRTWLTTGPLTLDVEQVDRLRDAVVGYVNDAAPSALGGAMSALRVLGAAVLAVFALFFMLTDGPEMWRWLLRWTPAPHRDRVDQAGRQAWETLTGYVRGVVVIDLIDATLIGAALFVVGVPLWASLTLLTFLGAFVPLLGATVAGAAAVLVTVVTNGFGDALIVLAAVLVVQQIEGNLLAPARDGPGRQAASPGDPRGGHLRDDPARGPGSGPGRTGHRGHLSRRDGTRQAYVGTPPGRRRSCRLAGFGVSGLLDGWTSATEETRSPRGSLH